MKLRLLLAGLSGLLAVSAASSAEAAPVPVCTPATMSPHAAIIPANLPGFAYTALAATSNDVHLFAGVSQTELPLTVGPADGLIKVTPQGPLVVGSSYRLEFNAFCQYGPTKPQGPITFTVAEAAPLPTKLGAALATPSVSLHDYGTTAFTITSSTTLDPEMKPWQSLYQLVLVIDGKLVSTRSIISGDDTVKVSADGWCDAALASTKDHTVQLRGRLPFAPTLDTLGTPITFDCPAPAIGTPTGSPPVAPPPGSTPGTSSGGNAGTSSSNGGSSGGCAIAQSAPRSALLPLLGLALGLAAVTRRRRPR